MPLNPTWPDIAIRLLLTLAAGALIGLDRGLRGHAAGLRTTILVALAAALAMIQTNILLPLDGKTSGSFAELDLMRLPLGILTGVGFIGGGTILKRGDLVTGVTTAASLWAVTVLGLLFGGGQLGLGVAGAALCVLTLRSLTWFEIRIPRQQQARLTIRDAVGTAAIPDLAKLAAPLGYRISLVSQERQPRSGATDYCYGVHWRRSERDGPPLDLIEAVGRAYDLQRFEITSGADG